MKKVLLICVIVVFSYGVQTLKPSKSFHASGNVQTMVVKDNLLYSGTSNGAVDIFNLSTKGKLNTIQLPKIKDFTGDTIKAKVYSVDFLKDSLLITSQGENGYNNIFVYKEKKLEQIINTKNKLLVQKANFITEDLILIGLLSNQVGLYDIKNKKHIYLTQLSMSSFSHFMVSEDKQTFISTDESGVIRIVNTKNGQVLKKLPAINLDKIYQLDYKNKVVLTAGQDRKSVVYKNNGTYSLDFDFLLYSCALNPKGDIGAVAYNEKNEVLVFDINSKKYLFNLVGQEATMTQILFINENELLVSSDSNKINYFKLGGKK
jgi:hypothetical protein